MTPKTPPKTSTKNLYLLKIDGAIINVKCAYYLKTGHIGITTFRNPEQFKHKKIVPTFTMNKHATTCSILKEHSKNMQHDPERLTTKKIFDIMEDIINDKPENKIPNSVSV